MLFSLLFLALLSGMPGCTPITHPPYQSLADSNFPKKGYIDYQIDPDTWLVTYTGYSRYDPFSPFSDGFSDPTKLLLDKKWLEGAQDYVLYRAAELARSRGADWFLVLHQDDWNHIGSIKPRRQPRKPIIVPGAGIVIRLLRNAPREPRDGVYYVDMLLTILPLKNKGLPYDLGVPSWESSNLWSFKREFRRWRAYSGPFDSIPLTSEGLIISRWSPETKATKASANQFELETWHTDPISPIMFLGECVKIAERERYDFFTVTNWMDEEHRESAWIWFRTKGIVTLHKSVPDSLKEVFRVTDVKPNVDSDAIKRKRLEDRDQVVDRDLKAGFIY